MSVLRQEVLTVELELSTLGAQEIGNRTNN